MSASKTDQPDERDPGGAAAEPSETRMREALDRLSGDRFAQNPRPQAAAQASFSSAGSRRHRYVQDGEVPVVQVSLRDRRRDGAAPHPASEPAEEPLRQALAQERASRLRAEQALERAQASLHALETRLGHAEITQREAVEHARQHESAVARLQAELTEQATRLKTARHETIEALRRQRELEVELDDTRANAVPDFHPGFELEAEPALDAELDDGLLDDDAVAPEPPPLVARHRKGRLPIVEAGRAPKPRAAKDLPPVAAAEPEPVKWWLAKPVTARKTRRA